MPRIINETAIGGVARITFFTFWVDMGFDVKPVSWDLYSSQLLLKKHLVNMRDPTSLWTSSPFSSICQKASSSAPPGKRPERPTMASLEVLPPPRESGRSGGLLEIHEAAS